MAATAPGSARLLRELKRVCPGLLRVSRSRRSSPLAAIAVALAAGVLFAGCRTAIDPTVIADAQTAARVKTALVNDPELGESAIEVRVVRGVAYLSGRVRSGTDAQRAADLARAVPGVTAVQPTLQVGGEPRSVPLELPQPRPVPDLESSDFESSPSLLAVGGTVGWSIPRAGELKTHRSISPLIRIGSPQGLAPTIGFDWFQADVTSAGGTEALTRIRIKPVMAGIGYTFVSNAFSVTPSIVAGYAFNSLTVTDVGVARGLPVEVGNSAVWRVGLSTWYDLGSRTAINASIGYVMTGLRLTVLDSGRLVMRDTSGDAAIVHAGLAYKLF